MIEFDDCDEDVFDDCYDEDDDDDFEGFFSRGDGLKLKWWE